MFASKSVLRTICFCLPALFAASSLLAQQPALPRVFEMNAATLARVKAGHDKAILALAIRDGDKALHAEPHSIVEKKQTPPSGDKHDWYSQAGYWWADPKNPNGPYIRHDGVKNPEKRDFTDESYFNHTVKSAKTLALAYYLTGNEKYAEHATLLLRTWFIDPATAMNPNLNYAQFVPGKNTGRPAGIVAARQMPQTLDAIGMLAGSKSWTAADDAAMKQWFAAYYKWLTTSAAGKEEALHPNNHGSWCQAQVAAIALYLGKTDEARQTLIYVRDQRIPSEIDDHGMQKYEMARTKSFSYSALNLHALVVLATLAQPLGMDLYKPVRPGAPGILTAVDALLPYDPQHPWPHEQIEKNREDSVCPALYFALGYTHDVRYTDGVKRFGCENTAEYAIIALGN
ncbi:MAG: alginate lyase family protein [Acidobacteriaceae bacterium]|nr:alginate lyase family protein [Acidobacteriaceae bacterium]